MRRTTLVVATSVIVAASAQAQASSPRLNIAMVGDWAPAVTLGVFWTKTLAPPPSLPTPGAGPAAVVESHWSLRALLSAGVTFAAPRNYAIDMTGFGYFGALRDAEIGPINRIGPVVVGSVNPNAAGVAARVEASARVVGLQLGWVRVFEDDTHRVFGGLDISFGFLACDILQRCRDGT